MDNLLIYGPASSGKSYIGKFLADAYHVPFFDLNEQIEERTGDKLADIVQAIGEEGFRNVEADIFEDLVFTHDNAVIALGNKTLLRESSKKIAESENVVIVLDWEKKDLQCGSSKDGDVNDDNQSRKLLDHYKSFAFQLTSLMLDPDKNQENGLSNIFIGKLYSEAIGAIICTLFKRSKISVVYDKNVEAVAMKLIDCFSRAKLFSGMQQSIVASEKTKSMKTVERILLQFDKHLVGRDDIVVSVGGGVTSDVVGFAASIWKRGIRWVNIPTTLLSMVDATIGGKTGVNYNHGKNLLGCFHKPSCVFIDYRFILTLKDNVLAEGYAEAYKHYLLDADMQKCFKQKKCQSVVDLLLKLKMEPMYHDYSEWKILAKFLNTKVKIVQKDPLELDGTRALLNVGHTIGHALEVTSKYKISHGNAVAIGICEELRLAKKHRILKNDQLLVDVERDLNALGLPTTLPAKIDADDLIAAMKKDKKNVGDKVKFILLEDYGKTIEFVI